MSRKLEGDFSKGRRAHDKRVQTETIAFRRPHAQDTIESVVFILIMVCHDRVGARVEACEFDNTRPLCGLYCLNFEALLLIRKRAGRIEKKNADGLGVVTDSLYCDVERSCMAGCNGQCADCTANDPQPFDYAMGLHKNGCVFLRVVIAVPRQG